MSGLYVPDRVFVLKSLRRNFHYNCTFILRLPLHELSLQQ